LSDPNVTRLTTHIVTAYLEHNPTSAADIPLLINLVHGALWDPSGLAASAQGAPIQRPSAGEIRKSITPGALVSFEDGKRYKQLKRSLANLGLTPSAYRECQSASKRGSDSILMKLRCRIPSKARESAHGAIATAVHLHSGRLGAGGGQN